MPCHSPCFLHLQRVATLLKDNRHYRRQVMQVQLAAAAGPADSSSDQQALALPATSHQHQLTPPGGSQTVPAGTAAADDSAADGNAAGTGLQGEGPSAVGDALSESLADAQQQVLMLSDENEKLMELSNSLRAENERLKALQV